MTAPLRWAWLVLAALVLLGWAYTMRYVGMRVDGDTGAVTVWDRWRHRACAFTPQRTICFGPGPTIERLNRKYREENPFR